MRKVKLTLTFEQIGYLCEFIQTDITSKRERGIYDNLVTASLAELYLKLNSKLIMVADRSKTTKVRLSIAHVSAMLVYASEVLTQNTAYMAMLMETIKQEYIKVIS